MHIYIVHKSCRSIPDAEGYILNDKILLYNHGHAGIGILYSLINLKFKMSPRKCHISLQCQDIISGE